MKEISLTQGKFALVDDGDFEFLNQYKWHAAKDRNTYYVRRGITICSQNKSKNIKRKLKMILIHRVILEHKLGRKLKYWENTDHISGDGLDNRKCNLRLCDQSKNGGNRKKQKTKTSSIYKGVSWNKGCKKWQAQIQINKKPKHLGCYENEIEAAKVCDKAALKYFGEFANTNFDS